MKHAQAKLQHAPTWRYDADQASVVTRPHVEVNDKQQAPDATPTIAGVRIHEDGYEKGGLGPPFRLVAEKHPNDIHALGPKASNNKSRSDG